MIEHINYNYSFVWICYEKAFIKKWYDPVFAVLWFCFTLSLHCICISTYIAIAKWLFCDGKHPSYIANVTTVYGNAKHLCIDMTLCVLHISTVAFQIQWLPLFCDFQRSPQPWPWPWIFKVKFWKSRISGMGWLIDMEWKVCESIECWTHVVTFNVHLAHDIYIYRHWILKVKFLNSYI